MNNVSQTLNIYGDQLIQAGEGHGADIASQRQDELDKMSIARVVELVKTGQQIRTLDLGSGRGAQTKRLLEAGSTLGVAVDQTDFGQEFYASLAENKSAGLFLPLDFRSPNLLHKIQKRTENQVFDIIVFQRTIHYFSHTQALGLLACVRSLMESHSRLYLSASGMGSELADGYPGKQVPLPQRFSPLSPLMAAKHGIHPPVCLYTTDELVRLCQQSGLRVLMAQESEFGNIKIIAEPL